MTQSVSEINDSNAINGDELPNVSTKILIKAMVDLLQKLDLDGG